MREMKDSGIEWIGEIPEGWKISRIKQLFSEVNDRCENGENYTLLSVSEYYGVAPKSERISDDDMLTHAETLDGYKICKENDLVMNIMLAWKRALGVSKYTGIVSPAYCIYRAKQNMCAKYFHYLFRTDMYANLFKQYSTGIIDSRLRLYPDKFLALKCQVPPIDTQRRIADYLDRKCRQIDAIIAWQQEVIEKLKAYKLSVITEAVTKGLNPNVPMKDSGVEWIGEIPEHWVLNKLKYLSLDIGDGIHATPTYDEDGNVYFVNGNNIGEEYLVFKEDTNTISDTEYASYKLPLLTGNTVFVTLNGATYGKISFYHGEKILLGKSAGFITLKSTESREFIRYYLQSYTAKLIMDLSLLGSTIANLSLRTLRDFVIPYPPIEEQIQIVNHLNNRTSSIDAAVSKKEKIVDELIDYKKSLIYEVVTGKKEV
ncbi:restriction endonuclease subunit S [Butyricicoccus sp. AM78-15b2TA]|uniref:restriction endonuclease subunit S n=1 Tax=Butyricicoccus sp. AM78-15b2TA TaxID=3002516 RepID=UPI0022E28AF8|nr:restriction endonuclease subunit S [Butyricicoccus sp. AM78-15b2TA]